MGGSESAPSVVSEMVRSVTEHLYPLRSLKNQFSPNLKTKARHGGMLKQIRLVSGLLYCFDENRLVSNRILQMFANGLWCAVEDDQCTVFPCTCLCQPNCSSTYIIVCIR